MEEPMTEEEVNQEFSNKIERGLFRPVDRFISDRSEAEDRLQDAICQTWATYRRYATEMGVVLDDPLLIHACRQRAVDLSRRFVGADDTRNRNQDVLDPRVFRNGLAVVLRLDWAGVDEGHNGRRSEEVGLAQEVAANPERKLNSALDLEKWVGGLSHRDRHLMEGKWLGVSTKQIAHDLDLSHSTAWRIEKNLGHDLARRAGVRVYTSPERRGRRHVGHAQ
jgi:DNA-directed RNA polymerase specialized sigma24 family protein